MKKNTKIWKTLFRISVVLSIIINFISIIADLFGFADGIGKHKNLFLDLLTFLASMWKWIAGASVVICLIIIIVLNIWKKQEEKRQAETLSWFDAEMKSTDFVGSLDYKFQLKQFLKQKDVAFSWWAVTGVAGIGKTRLVQETLNDDEFRNAEVLWLRYFSDYRIDALKKNIDDILGSPNFNNIIISEDAQVYMDNIGAFIEYVSQKTASEFGDHRLRLLLLIRADEDENLQDRYKQLASETSQFTLKQTRFSLYGQELRLSKYSEIDITNIVKSYIVNTLKKRREKKLDEEQLSALLRKTVNTLKMDNMDSEHLRPLFAMFIADALLVGAEPMSWNLINVFEYTALKHEKLLGEEIHEIKGKYSQYVFEKTQYIICMSIIRNGIELSELGEIGTELEDELKFAQIGLKDYFRELQLLGSDGNIRVRMPDILAEYFVLHTIVINPNTIVVSWVINSLCDSLKGVPEFSQKLRQDFRYMYENIEDELDDFYYAFFEKCDKSLATEIIKKQIAKSDFNDFNSIMLHEAIGNLIRNDVDLEWLSKEFHYLISLGTKDVNKWWCLSELERLAVNDQMIHDYCKSLISMMNVYGYNYRENPEEIAFCLSELKRFSNGTKANDSNAYLYCCGLVNTIDTLPETKTREEHLFQLKRISDIYPQNKDIVECYSKGLNKMMKDSIGTSKKHLYLSELKSLTDNNPNNPKITYWYSAGLLIMIGACDEEEKSNYFKELQRLFDAYPNDASIVASFCDGLIYMISFTTELEKKKELLSQIECLAHDAGYDDLTIAEAKYKFNLRYVINGQIFFSYCKGLLVLLQATPDMEEKKEYLSKINSLADDNPWYPDFLSLYSQGLLIVFDTTSDMEEKNKYLVNLKNLSKKSSSSKVFFPALNYCKAIFSMSHLDVKNHNYYMSELCNVLSNEEISKFIAANDQNFLYSIRRDLLDYQKIVH